MVSHKGYVYYATGEAWREYEIWSTTFARCARDASGICDVTVMSCTLLNEVFYHKSWYNFNQ